MVESGVKKITKKPWTNKEDKYLVENYEFMDNRKLAKELGRTTRSIEYRMGILFLKRGKPIYAYYKKDEYVASGTIEELAEMFGVKGDTIRHYMSPTYEKRKAKDGYGRIKVVRI